MVRRGGNKWDVNEYTLKKREKHRQETFRTKRIYEIRREFLNLLEKLSSAYSIPSNGLVIQELEIVQEHS